MKITPNKYAKRSQVRKVSITFDMDEPRYKAMQRLAGKMRSSHAHLLREGLNTYPGFNELHQEEKEAYAANQNRSTIKVDPIKASIIKDINNE